jgi:flagellin
MERLQEGSRTYIGFTDMSVSIEPVSTLNFRDIDIENNPNSVDASIQYIEKASKKVISAAAMLGSLQSRIGMQVDFADKLTDTIDRGVGRLVDADMDLASVRLKALQTQQQLGLQSLQIANSSAENIMQLFQ